MPRNPKSAIESKVRPAPSSIPHQAQPPAAPAQLEALAETEIQAPTGSPSGMLENRFGFVGTCPNPVGLSLTERMMAEGVLTREAIDLHLSRRSGVEIPLKDVRTKEVRNQHGARAGGVILDTVRDVSSSVFGSAVRDLTALMRGLDAEAWQSLYRWGWEPTKRNGAYVSEAHPGLNGFENLSRPGFYGKELSLAMLDVNRVLFPMVFEHAASLQGEAVDYLCSAASLTYQKDPFQILAEGLVSIMQAIDILTARQVESDSTLTLEEILDRIADSEVISHMALIAPFAVVAPMSVGIQKAEYTSGARVTSDGRVVEPQAFLEKVAEQDESRDGTPKWPTETLRGCPIATRSVVIGDDGQPKLTDTAPLSELARAYIDLVKVALKHPRPTSE